MSRQLVTLYGSAARKSRNDAKQRMDLKSSAPGAPPGPGARTLRDGAQQLPIHTSLPCFFFLIPLPVHASLPCCFFFPQTIPQPRNMIDSNEKPWGGAVPHPLPFEPWCPIPSKAAVGIDTRCLLAAYSEHEYCVPACRNLTGSNGQACFW